jgi:hypothetical protein
MLRSPPECEWLGVLKAIQDVRSGHHPAARMVAILQLR